MAQGGLGDIPSEVKNVYPKRKPINIAAAEGIEEQEVTGDRGTPDPEKAEKRRLDAVYDANHPPRKGK